VAQAAKISRALRHRGVQRAAQRRQASVADRARGPHRALASGLRPRRFAGLRIEKAEAMGEEASTTEARSVFKASFAIARRHRVA
jgi:hypothetical protein